LLPAGCREGAKPPAAPLQRVTIACAALPHSALLAVAFKKGYFAEEGLEAVPQMHPFGKVALDALLAGKADFATSAEIPILFAILKGERISPVAVIETSTTDEAIFARKDRGILAPGDLKGKRIGVTPGTNGEYFLDSYLMARLTAMSEITAVALKPEEMLPALRAGTLDAASIWHPHLLQMQKAFGAEGVTFYDKKIYTEMFCISARREYAARNPEIVRKLLRALVKAEAFVAQQPGLSVDLAADFLKIDRGLLAEMWKNFDYRVTLGQDLILTLENESRWAIKTGLTPATAVPNYLEYISWDGLLAVKPEAVTLLH
jgi:NitT/TauT family transport system substrate-binding protein